MKLLYFDCFSGISGDMTMAALVDAGADRDWIEQQLLTLPLDPFSLKWHRVVKQGVSALKLDVKAEQAPSHHHRHYADIDTMIKESELPQRVKDMSRKIFRMIGEAEGKIHQVPLEKVHFHEVGALDSIVDIIGATLAVHNLEIESIVASPIPLGQGTIKIDHGTYPVPAPATLEVMRGLPTRESHLPFELTTPTGAGIVAAFVEQFGPLPDIRVQEIGYGAGTRDLPDQPNVLRVVIGETEDHQPAKHLFTEIESPPLTV